MIQFMRGTSSQVQSDNPVLAAGQPFYETDTHVLKIGDGINAYKLLDAIGDSKIYADVTIGSAGSGYLATEVDFLCTGTNDEQVINSAIQSLDAGGTIKLLSGNYNISNPIELNISGIRLIGSGSGSTFVHYTGSSINDVSGIVNIESDNCEISHICFNQNNVSGMNFYNIYITGAASTTVSYCKTLGTTSRAISIMGDSVNTSVRCNYLDYYLFVGDVDFTIIENNYLFGTSQAYIWLNSSTNSIVSNNVIYSSSTDDMMQYGITTTGGRNIISGNTIRYCKTAIAASSSGNCITNNFIQDCNTGINLPQFGGLIANNVIMRSSSYPYQENQYSILGDLLTQDNYVVNNYIPGKNYVDNSNYDTNQFLNNFTGL